MRFECWTTKATHTRRIFYTYCFPRQQLLRERASMLRCTYIACLVLFTIRLKNALNSYVTEHLALVVCVSEKM
jgi:hypothetical protein